MTSRALRVRREHAAWFTGEDAVYEPLAATTPHALALGRGEAGLVQVVAVVTRLPVGLERAGGWGAHHVAVPAGRWRDLLTGGQITSVGSEGSAWRTCSARCRSLCWSVMRAEQPRNQAGQEISVWAPRAERVEIETGEPGATPVTSPMKPTGDGWWTWHGEVPAGAPVDYAFRVDGGDPRPDPRTPWQPHGVHGPSRLFDAGDHQWRDAVWAGPQQGLGTLGGVLYELHVGTFTAEGTSTPPSAGSTTSSTSASTSSS